jgi:hypothetical protein
VKTSIQALLTSVDNTLLGRVKPCDIHKLANSLNSERLMDLMVFQMKASGIFQEDHWYIGHIYLVPAFGCPIFQSLGRKKKL